MTDAEEKRFTTLIRALVESFGAKYTDGMLMGYRLGLDGIPLEDIERGVQRALKECKFMPKPVELRDMSGVTPLAVKAALAWTAVKKAVHSLSAYGSPDFEDPVVNAVIRNMGGWVQFCGRDSDTFETFTRKDFERLFVLFAPNGVSQAAGQHLVGIHSSERPKLVPVGYEVQRALPTNGQRQAIEGFVAGLLGEKR